jgi:DNA-binding CsgD family transcriptional regulator
MPSRMTITESDLRFILDLVDPARWADGGEFVPSSFLRDLTSLIPADEVTFEEIDPYARTIALQERLPVEDVDAPGEEDIGMWWAAFWEACSHPQRSGDFTSVRRSEDDLPDLHKGPRWHAFLEVAGLPRCADMAVSLTPRGTLDRRLLLFRSTATPFTDREALLLALLRPHLERLARGHGSAVDWSLDVTPRQREVLRLVAMGCTNAQIARRLSLSEGTVRKHLENAYSRLGVRSRSEAVARTLAEGA